MSAMKSARVFALVSLVCWDKVAAIKIPATRAGKKGGLLEENQIHTRELVLGATFLVKGGNLLFCLFLGNAVEFLQLAGQHLAVALDLFKLVVGQFAPLLAHFTLELFPITFNLIPIHFCTPFA